MRSRPGTARFTVEPVVSGYGDYHTMLLTRLAGGNAPDVMRVDSYYFFDFLQVNALRPIDDLITRDKIDTRIYYQQGIQENSSNGKALRSALGDVRLYMLINLKMIEGAGLKARRWTGPGTTPRRSRKRSAAERGPMRSTGLPTTRRA